MTIRLTLRVLYGLRSALALVEAGDAEDLTGYDDAQGQKEYNDALHALAWVRQEIANRENRRDEAMMDRAEAESFAVNDDYARTGRSDDY